MSNKQEAAGDGAPIETKADLIRLFERGERPKADWKIGTEHEKFVFRLADHKAPSWEEPNGIRDLLTAFGLQVETAADGQQALAKLAAATYDIVLMDCQMPVLDGYGATVAWRKQEADENRPRTPIAAITANALPSDRKRCLDCGMDDYLAKPYRREDLLGMLMKWLPAAS
jgi:CheY-like chemotaxis protein